MRGWRPYAFEVLIAIDLLVIAWFAPAQVLGTIGETALSVLPLSLLCALVGVGVRLAIVWRTPSRRRELLAVFRQRKWLVDSVRLQLGLVFLTHTYSWIKLLIPVIHPRLFDRQLFELDRAIFGGASPSVFLLTLFSKPVFLRFIDGSYANIFLGSLLIASSYFLSAPQTGLRVGYMTSNAAMWLIGAWLYVLIPSLGPAYRFPEVWLDYAANLVTTQNIQAQLMRNYRNVLRLTAGQPVQVKLVYGIAAFPSLHVAYQTLVALWMRREWIYGQIVFGICAFFIFIGSMITGWHYFVDGVAGVVIAAISYAIGSRIARRDAAPAAPA